MSSLNIRQIKIDDNSKFNTYCTVNFVLDTGHIKTEHVMDGVDVKVLVQDMSGSMSQAWFLGLFLGQCSTVNSKCFPQPS